MGMKKELEELKTQLQHQKKTIEEQLQAVEILLKKLSNNNDFNNSTSSIKSYENETLTNAMRDVLKTAYPNYLYPREVKSALLEGGFRSKSENIANSVRAVIWHLVNKNEVEFKQGEGSKKYRYKEGQDQRS